ncbi:phosphodiester glycosidase family protein [Clostridium intestinale]|uniref:Phosphodiester glycosidase family protein n=2 Tax=Clostridium intestinale TaxID=36845 RepID=A0A7D6VQ75_9CLOT|nr:phosphodiester glycosidase family protein [Clostridium intestinale]
MIGACMKRMIKNLIKNTIVKKIIVFLLFQLIFTVVIFPLYTFYGPFTKVRDMLVGLSMSTGNYQFVAKMFFSEEDINNILQEENIKNNKEAVSVSTTKVEMDFNLDYIEKININTNKFEGIALIVKDSSKVKVGYSSKLGTRGETVTEMAERYNALAAINGGGYSDVSPTGKTGGTGGAPLGIIISNGQVIFPKNNENYNIEENCVFSIDDKGKMYVGPASVNSLIEKKVQEALSFSPTLIVNGEPYISENSLGGVNPRTAIGQRKDGSIILLVLDGRQGLKLGATLKDVQTIMINLEAENAMCLDGGGSTAMYYKGEIVNNPSSVTGERAVPNIVYVKP